MVAQMRFYLILGLRDEAQAHTVACGACEHPEQEASGVPERIEEAFATIEFSESLGAPGEVVLLFRCRLKEMLASLRGPGHYGLATIESLGGYLSGMVDAHQRADCGARLRSEFRLRQAFGGGRASGFRRAGQGPQRLVGRPYEAVLPSGHCCHPGIITSLGRGGSDDVSGTRDRRRWAGGEAVTRWLRAP